MHWYDQIYRYSPTSLQHLLVSLYGLHWKRLRFGGQFHKEIKKFRQREYWSHDDLQYYQEGQLRSLLVLAFTRVPYYKDVWKGLVTVDQLSKFTVADLKFIPPLEKQVARDNPQSLLVDGKRDRRHIVFYTSGSTGTPVTTYWLPEELQRSLALRETRSCNIAGVSFSMPRATFSGRIVEPNPKSKGPFYRFNFAERQVYFSAFHLGPSTVAQYINALRRHKIIWITGYSNSIYQLAQLATDQRIAAPTLKSVITTSEKITPEMRAVIEEYFSTKVYEEYATVEDLFYVCENEYGEKLISPDAGVVEVVGDDFAPLPVGEQGEVLATGFIRTHQLMIRYRVGDIAVLSDKKPSCGRQMPVMEEVIGRIEDTIYAPDGRRMVRFHGIFVNQPHIQEGQIVQKQLNHIHVRVVPKAGFSQEDENDIEKRIQQRLSADVTVSIEKVDHIERTKSGKFKAVISEISKP